MSAMDENDEEPLCADAVCVDMHVLVRDGLGDNPGIAVRRRCCGTVWRAVGDRVRVTYNER